MATSNHIGDTFTGPAIPQWRRTATNWRNVQHPNGLRTKTLRIPSDELVRALSNRDRTLRVIANSQARHTKIRGFLLNASGIGDDDGGLLLESQKFHVPEWFGQSQRVGHSKLAPIDRRASARMNRKHDIDLGGDLHQDFNQGPQHGKIVDIRWAVERDERVPTCDAKRPADAFRVGAG